MPSFEKSPLSGLWSVRFREKDPDSGRLHQKRLSGYKTKKEAQYGYEDYLADYTKRVEETKIITEAKKDPANLQFKYIVELYMQFKQNRVRETSFYTESRKINNKILPFFGEYTFADITPAMILQWQNSLTQFSYDYQKHLNTIMVSIFKFANRYHDIPDIMSKVDRPRNPKGKKKMLFWTPNEFKRYQQWQENNYKVSSFVFGGSDPLPPTTIERKMTLAAQRASVKRIRVHDLRHSHASFLLHKTKSIAGLSERLGHSSKKETLDTYSHMLPDDDTMIQAALEDLSENLVTKVGTGFKKTPLLIQCKPV